ncbi:MAG: inositol monophosphatase [bacterium]
MNIDKAKRIAVDSVKKAGDILIDNLNEEKKLYYKDTKNTRDFTTEIDLKSENIIVNAIKELFPDHGFVSEEMGKENETKEFVWVLDPIDGTLNYSKGLPLFSIGLCLLQNQKPILGMNFDPITKNFYFAEKGKGATLNNKKISVSNCDDLNKAMLISHISSTEEKRRWLLENLNEIYNRVLQIRFLGVAHNSQSFIAAGQADVFFEISTFPWDILPCTLIIEEAGGKVTEINGDPITLESSTILATNGKLHDEMLKLLAT